jgi:hypothetical protein
VSLPQLGGFACLVVLLQLVPLGKLSVQEEGTELGCGLQAYACVVCAFQGNARSLFSSTAYLSSKDVVASSLHPRCGAVRCVACMRVRLTLPGGRWGSNQWRRHKACRRKQMASVPSGRWGSVKPRRSCRTVRAPWSPTGASAQSDASRRTARRRQLPGSAPSRGRGHPASSFSPALASPFICTSCHSSSIAHLDLLAADPSTDRLYSLPTEQERPRKIGARMHRAGNCKMALFAPENTTDNSPASPPRPAPSPSPSHNLFPVARRPYSMPLWAPCCHHYNVNPGSAFLPWSRHLTRG